MNPFKTALVNRTIQQESEKYPVELQRVPEEQWPEYRPNELKEVWRSRKHLVQIYAVPGGIERLSVLCAILTHEDEWQDGITWDELQRLKHECGRGDKFAVEVFPSDADIVNVANMRHLWVLPEAPAFAWKRV